MGKVRPGNKQNAALNREYGKVKGFLKKLTSRMRRNKLSKNTSEQVKEGVELHDTRYDEELDDMN